MEVGIGLPAMVPGIDRDSLIEWAKESEANDFPSLGVLDRLVYPNYEPLVSLAAAAAVTERIRLTTMILITPIRRAPIVAKQAATIDSLSNGRLVLGLGLGARDDDYAAAGVPVSGKGARFDEQLDEMRSIWAGEPKGTAGPIGPPMPRERPLVVIGGQVEHSFRRAARWDGWTMGGGTPDQLEAGRAGVERAWQEAGRDGKPRIMALAYFSLGPNARENAEQDLGHYYAWLGEETARAIAGSAAVDEDMVKQYIQGFDAAGCDELILFPCSTDVEQVRLLAAALP
jgi:alkanesulfonate monooxygenase SsuD/methylene tetrahydromethanopterin reductase-like flavin-dependent oxidoreductase (luciferase family)